MDGIKSNTQTIVNNDASRQAPLAPHAQGKQEKLNNFAETYFNSNSNSNSNDIKQGMDVLKRELAGGEGLFKNNISSWWNRTMPESACLAMVATAVKVFGGKVLDGHGQLDAQKLDMAMHMLFGKDMPAIQGDMLSNLRLEGDKLHSRHYEIIVGDLKGAEDLNTFVNAASVDQSYFHGKTGVEVASFFGGAKAPAIIDECTGKNYQKNPKIVGSKADHIATMAEKMKKDAPIYNNTTVTKLENNTEIEHSLNCKFLIDSAPSLREKYELSEVHNNERDLPVNIWRADFSTSETGKDKTSSHVTLAGSQHTSDPEINKTAAGKIIDAVLENKPNNGKPKTMLLDLRVLTTINKKVVSGSEAEVFHRHVNAMREAVKESVGNEDGNVSYVPIHCEAHSHLDVIFAKTVGPVITALGVGVAVVAPMVGVPMVVAGTAATGTAHGKTTFSSDKEVKTLKTQMNTLFDHMSQESQKKFTPVLTKWNELVGDLHHERHAIPFATLTKILSDAISADKDGDTNVEFIVGCKSAKDRTTSVVAGINLLEPLILGALGDDKKNINNLFDRDGYFDMHHLTVDEKLMMKDLYDVRLLHAANKLNAGVAGNVSSDILKDSFFKNVDFIHESTPHTIMIGS